MATKLFRQQAIDAQREKLLGEVSLARTLPLWGYTALALVFALGLVAFSIWGEYARRERVDGFLALDSGAARLLAPQAGTIVEILAKEGEEVAAGQPLIRLSFDRGTASGVTAAACTARNRRSHQGFIVNSTVVSRQTCETLRRRWMICSSKLRVDREIGAAHAVASSRNEYQRSDICSRIVYSESKL